MSESKKKKKKVIHVDELVVKADKVIFVNDKDKDKDFDRRPRDPWGGLFPRREERDFHRAEDETENQQEEPKQEDRRRGWSWI